MITAFILILAGVLSRLLPHPPNAVALGAIALFAAARLPRRWALTIPLFILIVSDYALDTMHGYPFYFASRLTTYALFTTVALAGSFAPEYATPLARGKYSLMASTLFFLVSNLAVWYEGTGYEFPRTVAGLVSTYEVALPFFRNSLLADLVGTVVLFGLDGLLSHRSSTERAVTHELV